MSEEEVWVPMMESCFFVGAIFHREDDVNSKAPAFHTDRNEERKKYVWAVWALFSTRGFMTSSDMAWLVDLPGHLSEKL